MPIWKSDQDLNRVLQYLHDQGIYTNKMYTVIRTCYNYIGVLLYYKDYWRTHIFCIDIQWICRVVANILFSLRACNGMYDK